MNVFLIIFKNYLYLESKKKITESYNIYRYECCKYSPLTEQERLTIDNKYMFANITKK